MADNAYVPESTFNDACLSDSDRERVALHKQEWEIAARNNDVLGMEKAHAAAEWVRSQYGYSGGSDGSAYIPLGSNAGLGSSSLYTGGGGASQPYYSGSTIAAPGSYASSVESIYAAMQEANLAALKSAYDQNMLTMNAQKEKISPYYQSARNETATQSEMNRAAFNEYAAAKGLSSGAGGQASLAMGNALQRDMSGLYVTEANAFAEIENQRASLETAYQNDIAQAIANGNLSKAQALYSEYVRYDNAMASWSQAQASENYRTWSAQNETYNTNYNNALKRAQMLAQFGDYSGLAALGMMPQQAYQPVGI